MKPCQRTKHKGRFFECRIARGKNVVIKGQACRDERDQRLRRTRTDHPIGTFEFFHQNAGQDFVVGNDGVACAVVTVHGDIGKGCIGFGRGLAVRCFRQGRFLGADFRSRHGIAGVRFRDGRLVRCVRGGWVSIRPVGHFLRVDCAGKKYERPSDISRDTTVLPAHRRSGRYIRGGDRGDHESPTSHR